MVHVPFPITVSIINVLQNLQSLNITKMSTSTSGHCSIYNARILTDYSQLSFVKSIENLLDILFGQEK